MKNRVIVPLLFIMTAALLQAETVLIFTRNSHNPELEAVMEQQSAIEDGVMEAFFDAGHIVFNAGIVETNEKLEIPSERLSFRMAKQGGAYYLLEIDVDYRDIDDSVEVSSAAYRFYDVMSGDILTEGSLTVADVESRPDTPVKTVCSHMGASIASGALSKLHL